MPPAGNLEKQTQHLNKFRAVHQVMPAPSATAIVLVDPYNDFLHPEGKLTPALKDLEEKNTLQHIHEVVAAARLNEIPIVYALHQQWTPNSYHKWHHMTTSHVRQQQIRFFEEGSFGAEIYKGLEPDLSNGDVLSNTDLDFQLRQRDIKNLVFIGLTANTCLEATARHAYELGYQVKMLDDATAGWSKELTDAATGLIWPLFSQVQTSKEWVESLDTKVI